MRIREGDPLEIYTDKDGGVIFKKYSLMAFSALHVPSQKTGDGLDQFVLHLAAGELVGRAGEKDAAQHVPLLMGGLVDFAGQLCETLNRTTGQVTVITDARSQLLSLISCLLRFYSFDSVSIRRRWQDIQKFAWLCFPSLDSCARR